MPYDLPDLNDHEEIEKANRSRRTWRGLILLCLFGLTALLIVVVYLFTTNHDRISQTQQAISGVAALDCRIGAFFVDQPITQQPDQTDVQFQRTVRSAQVYLNALKAQGCTGVKHADISAAKINQALRRLRRADTTAP